MEAGQPSSRVEESPALQIALMAKQQLTFFSNKRTFLDWLKIAVLICMTAFSLMSGSFVGKVDQAAVAAGTGKCVSCSASKVSGAVIAPVALLFLGYALLQYRKRTTQVCEVHVQLSHCRASTVHTVSAALASDGSRNYKLNGKNKTGKEIKEFLRSVGISVDSSGAVIKQAQVTRLADLNSPAELAAVVADASGLGRWNQERRTAAEELARTSSAITAVQEKLHILELSLEEDSKALAALQRLEAVEAELGTAEGEIAAKLAGALAGCEASLASAVQQVATLQLDVAAKERDLAALDLKMRKLEEELAAAGAGTQNAVSANIQRAALQEEVAILKKQIMDCAQQHELLEERREAAKLTSAQLAHITAMIPAALAGNGSGQVASSMMAQLQQQADLLGSKQREHESLLASIRSQQASLAAAGTAPCMPLHLCFQFRSPTTCAEMATALDIIGGRCQSDAECVERGSQ
ncbi:hypothetical protein N2152v2_010271 [Parachlorella kessleri]